MINGDVCDAAVSTQKVSTLSMDVHDWKYLIIFKGVETPAFFGDTCFWGFTVFNDYTPESVGVLKKCPGKFEAWLFFSRHLFVFTVATRSRSHLLSLITTATDFILLAMLPASGIIKLSLFLLSLQVLVVSIPSLSLSTPRPLSRAPPLVGMAPVSVSVTVPSSPVFLF
jgi:hypothetical protein